MLFQGGFSFANFLTDVPALFLFVVWFWLLVLVYADLFRRHDISAGVRHSGGVDYQVLWSRVDRCAARTADRQERNWPIPYPNQAKGLAVRRYQSC